MRPRWQAPGSRAAINRGAAAGLLLCSCLARAMTVAGPCPALTWRSPSALEASEHLRAHKKTPQR